MRDLVVQLAMPPKGSNKEAPSLPNLEAQIICLVPLLAVLQYYLL